MEAELLQAMMTALPAKYREVVRLRFYAEATEPEIAAALGIPAGHREEPAPPRPGKASADERQNEPTARGGPLTPQATMKTTDSNDDDGGQREMREALQRDAARVK